MRIRILPLALAVFIAVVACVPSLAAEANPSSQAFRSVRDFGAAGDGKRKDTAAIQRAVDAAAEAGGGTVLFPPGRYLSGTIFLRSGVRLHVDFGAALLGSTLPGDYPANECGLRSYTDNYVRQALLWGENLHDVAVTGHGDIDGQGEAFRDLPWLQRPYAIRFIACRNVLIEGITLRNSAMWMQHYLACDLVTIRGITVYNHCNANNDMIDIDGCRDVRISDCLGDTDDDALTLKSTQERPCENVAIANCVLASHCNAIKMGTESNGGFRNVTITNCAVRRSSDDTPICGRREGMAGLALEIVDGGTLDRVAVSNVVIDGVTTPLFLRLGDRARPFRKDMPRPGVGSFRNVVLSNIVATGGGPVGCSITGLPGHPIENVTLADVKIAFAGGGTKEDFARAVPELPEKYPESSMFGTLPAYGFYCRHVDGLTLRGIDLRVGSDDLRPALVCDDVRELDVDRLAAQCVPDGAPMIVLDAVRSAMVRGCRPPAVSSSFLRLQGACEAVAAIGNDLSRVATPFQLDDKTPRTALHEAANRMKKP